MNNSKVLVSSAFLLFGVSTSVFAAGDIDWKVCAKEMKTYSCAGSNKDVWMCLANKSKKLSTECHAVNTKGNSLFRNTE
jgi:hypothetical protein